MITVAIDMLLTRKVRVKIFAVNVSDLRVCAFGKKIFSATTLIFLCFFLPTYILTSQEHRKYREYLFDVRRWSHVSESDASKYGECKVERSYVARDQIGTGEGGMRFVDDVRLISQRMEPADAWLVLSLEPSDGVEDTGEPVRDEHESSHE